MNIAGSWKNKCCMLYDVLICCMLYAAFWLCHGQLFPPVACSLYVAVFIFVNIIDILITTTIFIFFLILFLSTTFIWWYFSIPIRLPCPWWHCAMFSFLFFWIMFTLCCRPSLLSIPFIQSHTRYSALKIVRWPDIVRFRSKSQNTHYIGQIYVNIIMWCCVYTIDVTCY